VAAALSRNALCKNLNRICALVKDGWTISRDRLDHYRTLLRQLLTEHAEKMEQQPAEGLDTELVFDEEHDNSMLFVVGW
jgi:hypothetical protein